MNFVNMDRFNDKNEITTTTTKSWINKNKIKARRKYNDQTEVRNV